MKTCVVDGFGNGGAAESAGVWMIESWVETWRWNETALVGLAAALDRLGFEQTEPDPVRVACWTARGLTAYDGAHVAVAEALEARLITDDDVIVEIAKEIAQPLTEIRI